MENSMIQKTLTTFFILGLILQSNTVLANAKAFTIPEISGSIVNVTTIPSNKFIMTKSGFTAHYPPPDYSIKECTSNSGGEYSVDASGNFSTPKMLVKECKTKAETYSDWMFGVKFLVDTDNWEYQEGSYDEYYYGKDYHHLTLVEIPEMLIKLQMDDGSDVNKWMKDHMVSDFEIIIKPTSNNWEPMAFWTYTSDVQPSVIRAHREFNMTVGKTNLNELVSVTFIPSGWADRPTLDEKIMPLGDLYKYFKSLETTGFTFNSKWNDVHP
jgi:hypothetical protein